jgi:serine protease Do
VACRGFDGQVVHQDQRIVDLLTNLVCVRMVQANAMDLTLFQFDYDLTFAAFFLNADRTIYGRFGSRSNHKEAEKDISIEGFRDALSGALELHRNYPRNKQALAGKQPRPVKFKAPEAYPSLAGKYKPALDYEGQVVRSCLHCHQVREAERESYRTSRQPIPDEVLFPYPMPDAIGLELDPKEKARVLDVTTGSAAAKAGFALGDEIVSFGGQPILSLADVQWVLHNAPQPVRLSAVVRRGDQTRNLAVELGPQWRQAADISWRATTWDLRKMATGGLVLKESSEPRQGVGLLVDYVGQYNEHAAGKKAGFQKGDIFMSADGQNATMTEGQFLRYMLQNKVPGARVPVAVSRSGQKLELQLPMQ